MAVLTTLSDRTELLIRQAVKHTGTYDPNECLFTVEEEMTLDEYDTAEAFLRWIHDGDRTFGHNIREVFAEWVGSR